MTVLQVPTILAASDFQYENLVSGVNIGFTMICAVLVLLMQLGFAMLETGLNSHKHAANILFKNLADLCIGAVTFGLIGYGIMWPEYFADDAKWFTIGVGIPDGGGVHWFYQMAFAATAATIVSGAVAGRMKFHSYLVFSAVLAGVVYPFIGRLCWSNVGLFSQWGFHDLAGSVVVHAVGGTAALSAIIILRPRCERIWEGERFDGHHNLVYAILGALLLWVGWYGFNAGSIGDLVGDEAELQGNVGKIVVNTTLGAASGALAAMGFWFFANSSKIDLKAAINGCLGGLVAITASCDIIPYYMALVYGGIAGILTMFVQDLLDSKRWDDTVGAVPVHGACGIFGGFVASFHSEIIWYKQLTAIVVCVGIVFALMTALFYLMNVLKKLEVSEDDERRGLDVTEHDLQSYIPPLERVGLRKSNLSQQEVE